MIVLYAMFLGAAFLAGAELLCACIMRWRRASQRKPQESTKASQDIISDRYGTDFSALAKEVGAIYFEKARYNPIRWYSLPSNYRGRYVTTDEFGLRNQRARNSLSTAKILFFGNSTMFSTKTRDSGSIPSIINRQLMPELAEALNYGVGGYSTYAEVGAFCEAIRREKNVSMAVFYDGVNEIAMYVDMIQAGQQGKFYEHAGYPFMSVTRTALKNFLEDTEKRRYYPNTLEFAYLAADWLKHKFGHAPKCPSFPDEDLRPHAARIVDSYVANVRILQALGREFGITCAFIWQPDIFTTGKALTQRETALIARHPAFVQELTRLVKTLVVTHAALNEIGLIDATSWIDELEGDHFFDFCHVSEEANELIAHEIGKICRRATPSMLWRNPL